MTAISPKDAEVYLMDHSYVVYEGKTSKFEGQLLVYVRPDWASEATMLVHFVNYHLSLSKIKSIEWRMISDCHMPYGFDVLDLTKCSRTRAYCALQCVAYCWSLQSEFVWTLCRRELDLKASERLFSRLWRAISRKTETLSGMKDENVVGIVRSPKGESYSVLRSKKNETEDECLRRLLPKHRGTFHKLTKGVTVRYLMGKLSGDLGHGDEGKSE